MSFSPQVLFPLVKCALCQCQDFRELTWANQAKFTTCKE